MIGHCSMAKIRITTVLSKIWHHSSSSAHSWFKTLKLRNNKWSKKRKLSCNKFTNYPNPVVTRKNNLVSFSNWFSITTARVKKDFRTAESREKTFFKYVENNNRGTYTKMGGIWLSNRKLNQGHRNSTEWNGSLRIKS